jgi:hypothetical protein
MGGMGPLVGVEGDPASAANPGIRVGFPGVKIGKAFVHLHVGDVVAPDLIWPVDLQAAQQIGVGGVPLRGGLLLGF